MARSKRLAEKIIAAKEQALSGSAQPDLSDLLCSGEDEPCNIIPGNTPSVSHPIIVVYSIKQFPPAGNSPNHTPEYCLGLLEKHLIERSGNATCVKLVKIIIDRIDPGVAEMLSRIIHLTFELEAELQVDLILSDKMDSISLERSLHVRSGGGFRQVK